MNTRQTQRSEKSDTFHSFYLLALLFGSAVVVMAQTEHIPPFTGTCSRYSSPSSHMREKGAQN